MADIKTVTKKITLKDIKAKTDEIGNIKTETDKIAGIVTKIEALEKLVGTHNDTDPTKDTGIYEVIYNNFTELMGP